MNFCSHLNCDGNLFVKWAPVTLFVSEIRWRLHIVDAMSTCHLISYANETTV